MRLELPTGTVTFLFTDVEGSTRLLHDLGEAAYADALAEHRRVIRDACTLEGGVEVDTQGDALFFAFPMATAALAAAYALTEGLASGSVRVRVGVHTGTALVTGEGYVGFDVHRAARMAAAGHGGQVLLAASTAALVDADLVDLGDHRFKDLAAPERIYQLGRREFPPLRSLHHANLPLPGSPFLGRERELDEVLGLLGAGGTRLLTLTGPGGTGKTRLGLEAAAALADRYPGGVWWVPLAAVPDPGLVLDAAALSLDAKAGLTEHIGSQSLLLLFDNFEHVVAAGPELAQLLGDCQGLDVLVTSREPLHLRGEQEYPVPPLEHEESVRFFVARARAVEPGFTPTDEVSEICRRLDDLPLALELAAARVKVLSPEELLARLDERLPLLVGGARDLPERQRTLRSTIEWSFELLGTEERNLFARLAVFSGGCTLRAAEEVARADLDTLHSLVDKSLVRRTDDRYWMLESIREFASERLAETEEAERVARRHADFSLELVQTAEPQVTGPEQRAWLERLAAEHENLRSALAWHIDAGDHEGALRLASSLVVYWFVRGHYREGLGWLERALDQPGTGDSSALAKALWGAGFFGVLVGDIERAVSWLEDGLGMARRVDDRSTAARCLAVLALLAFFRNEPEESRALLEASIEAARIGADTWCLADSLGTLASILPLQGDVDAAEVAGREGLAVAREAGDEQGVRMSLFGLALAAVRRGSMESALRFADEGLEISRRISDPWFTSYFQWIRATVALEHGDLEEARSAATEALDVGERAGGALLVVCAREVLARVAWRDGDESGARQHLEDALAAVEQGGIPGSYVSAVEFALGELCATAGDGVEARAHFDASLSEANRAGDVWASERAKAGIHRLL